MREPHERLVPFGKRDAIRLVVAALLIVLALAAGVPGDLSPVSPGYADGAVATADIRAPRDAAVPNDIETQAAAAVRASSVPPQYDFTVDRALLIASAKVADLQLALKPLDDAFSQSGTADVRRVALQAALPTALPTLSLDNRTALLALEPARWIEVEKAAEGALYAGEQVEIRDTDLASIRSSLAARYLGAYALSVAEAQLAGAIATPFFVANSTYSASLTDQAGKQAAADQQPVVDSIKAGEVLVPAGAQITKSDMIKIQFFGLDKSTADWSRAAAWMLLGTIVAVLMLGWLWRFRPEYWVRSRTLTLIGLIFVVSVLATKFSGGQAWIPYAIPAAAAGILLTLLLDSGVGIVAMAVLAILAGSVSGSSAEMTAYVFLGGFAGILAIRKGERQHFFVQAGLAVAVAEVAVVGAFALLGEHDMTGMLQLWGVAVAGALLATIISLGSFSLLGNLFGILTGSQLLELANPSQPLLRRLLIETPGTYHHSLMVGNLGERAASAIGADPLLVRAAAYYHDIGKLSNPLAFIENQAGGDNIHDQLDPADSATILRQHVADGMSLAHRAGLPNPLIAFIPQHHGTAILGFVYGKARDEAARAAGGMNTPAGKAAAEAVDQRRYRHTGPKPQSREAAILMLADGVEASVRSLTSRDEATIRAMVGQIIQERLNDGQLNECDLTIRDLENIREAFVGQLLGMYHQRIAYPQNEVVEPGPRPARGAR
ncbi:MAG TPA: HDIG domain-containing protein [Candidatus Limnocylindrales bacterium]